MFRLKSFSTVDTSNEINNFFSKFNSVIENNFAEFQEIFKMKNNEVEKKLEECDHALSFFRKYPSFEPSNVNERKLLLFLATIFVKY